jgi:hypothetical protein
LLDLIIKGDLFLSDAFQLLMLSENYFK